MSEITYNRSIRSVELNNGIIIADVLGTDPTPDGPRWVGYTVSGSRLTWFAADVKRVIDIQYDAQTTWVDEQMGKQ